MSDEREMNDVECRCLYTLDCEKHQLTQEKRLKIMDDVIEKIKRTIYVDSKLSFTAEEYAHIMSCACSLALGERNGRLATKLYNKFFSALEATISTVILPALEGKEFKDLFIVLLVMWNKYKQMAHWLVRFCDHLQFHPHITNGVTIAKVPTNVICERVFDVLWNKVQGTITFMIKQERDKQLIIDQDLLKRIIEFCIDIQNIGNRPYYRKLERAILDETTTYYSKFAPEWLLCSTFGGYIRKVGHWYEREERQKQCYLSEALLAKVLKVARDELLDKHIEEVAELIPSSGLGLVRLMPKSKAPARERE